MFPGSGRNAQGESGRLELPTRLDNGPALSYLDVSEAVATAVFATHPGASVAGMHPERLHIATRWAPLCQVPGCCSCPGESALLAELSAPGLHGITHRNPDLLECCQVLVEVSSFGTEIRLIPLRDLWSDLLVGTGCFSGRGPDGFILSLCYS